MKNVIIVYPTDTVWGIGGSIYSKEVYNSIAKIKRTKLGKPLSILFTDKIMLEEYIDLKSEKLRVMIDDLCTMETTFALPRTLLKKQLPNWCLFDEPLVFIRFLPYLEVQSICKKIGGPIFSTSLNYTNENPIVDGKEAKDFFDKNVKGGEFVEGHNRMSGKSSSILLINEKMEIKILREGSHIKSIKKLMSNLTLDEN